MRSGASGSGDSELEAALARWDNTPHAMGRRTRSKCEGENPHERSTSGKNWETTCLYFITKVVIEICAIIRQARAHGYRPRRPDYVCVCVFCFQVYLVVRSVGRPSRFLLVNKRGKRKQSERPPYHKQNTTRYLLLFVQKMVKRPTHTTSQERGHSQVAGQLTGAAATESR